MRETKVVEILASAAQIGSVNSAYIDTAAWDEAHVFLVVTAKTSTPTTLDAAVTYSFDYGTTYAAPVTAEPFTQVTGATSTQCLKLTNLGKGFRVEVTMVGGEAGKGWTFYIEAVLKRLS